ncbi:alanine/glycine:cation symporter family protein [Streptomonospora salina]|uniref:AGCS family alanine or glycine:cation symporter n=1 Tax=Streptomonospora salina TaxID=104205 RepID=A0A841E597_9ACTN|nr:alanine/glycine:cation symporter family protein [Streptomonospora salina]MBB5998315.1 AGCS family alanine or glycine:cation symporter [Streptomonospora salina]
MEEVNQLANDLVTSFTDVFWAWILIPVLAGLSVYFTIRLGAVQLRLLPEMFRTLRSKPETAPDGKKAISSFQAFSISAAARIGTGNVVGVAGAIAVGGPGAVLWMWVMGLLVGAASFVESTLGQLYKVRDPSGYRGGPAYYMQHGLNARWMGVIFAVAITVTFGFVFNAVQSNTIANAIANSAGAAGYATTGWVTAVVGLLLVAVTSMVVFGGVRRIARVAQTLVPFMAVFYILMALVVVVLNVDQVPAVLDRIVQSAFGLQEFAGATLGTVIIQGVRRGMFSNEAGLGSAPNAGATAGVTHPVKQGLVQTLGVFFDTLIVCSMTAFLILSTDPTYGAERGPLLTQEALETGLGGWSLHALTLVLLLLAFSSILGNFYYGQANVAFLTENRGVMTGFKVIFLIATFLGSIGTVQIVWSLADTAMGFMAFVNLMALAPLVGVVGLVLKDYVAQRKQGLDPVFTRDRLPQLRGVQCWDGEQEPSASDGAGKAGS